MTKDNLVIQVAKIIDETAFAMTPKMYDLKTESELCNRTLVGGARSVAIIQAKKIIALVRKVGAAE